MRERKVKNILNWKAPRLVNDVQLFIGFANLYRQFMENFSNVCKAITDMLNTKEGKHLWFEGEEQAKAFEVVK